MVLKVILVLVGPDREMTSQTHPNQVNIRFHHKKIVQVGKLTYSLQITQQQHKLSSLPALENLNL
jgi:hypothetical protein